MASSKTWMGSELVVAPTDAAITTGHIPPDLGNLAAVTDLWLNNNQLSGKAPQRA